MQLLTSGTAFWTAGGEEGEEPEQHQGGANGEGDGHLREADDWDVPQRL